MPRFAANLGYLFTEHPLVERPGAAARAGFAAIELQFPFDVPAPTMKAEIERHGLTMLGINTAPGRTGESGLAAVPGREHDFAVVKDKELGTVAGIARLAAGFVGNDSGVSHLAAAADAPGVVIFGPTYARRWRPLGRIAVIDQRATPDEVATALTQISDRDARKNHLR